MKHYNIIFLVIASPSIHYNRNKLVLSKFMNSNKNIKTFFIYGNVDKSKVLTSRNDLYFDCIENLKPGILIKTIKAFKYIKKNFTYNYVIRTNISTFWNFKLLLSKINKYPKEKCLAGHISPRKFLFGTGIVLSKDLVDIIINDKNKLNYKIPDDLSLSYYLRDNYKIKYINEKRCTKFTDKIPVNKNIVSKHFTSYRIKTKKNRNLDSYKLFKLWKFFYR